MGRYLSVRLVVGAILCACALSHSARADEPVVKFVSVPDFIKTSRTAFTPPTDTNPHDEEQPNGRH